MLFRISQRIVSVWSNEQIIQNGSEEAYVYGVQLLLSTVMNVLCIAVISVFAGKPFAWIPFLTGFIPIRITAGGFHAKTPFRCFSIFCVSYSACILLLNVVNDNLTIPWIIINSLIVMLVVYRYSPLPAANKPLSALEMKQKRMLSFMMVALLLLLKIVILTCFKVVADMVLYLSLGEMLASTFCVIAKYCRE